MKNELKISVIIPVLNGEKYLAEAIESVLEQNYEPLEIIVVDDGSTDNTRKIVKTFKQNIRYIYQINKGLSTTLNKGLALARGNIITFIDADDLWVKEQLENHLSYFHKDPTLEIIIGRAQRFYFSKEHNKHIYLNEAMVTAALGAATFKKSVFDKLGNFDQDPFCSHDLDYFMRIREQGVKTIVLNDVSLLYRRHESNVTNDDQSKLNRCTVTAFRNSLKRRRTQGQTNSKLLPPVNYDDN